MSNDKQKTGVDLFYDELVETTPFSISGIYALYKKAKKRETKMMIEFAKFHVESALKAVAENADVKYLTPPRPCDRVVVDMVSIYNAYPLENIKWPTKRSGIEVEWSSTCGGE